MGPVSGHDSSRSAVDAYRALGAVALWPGADHARRLRGDVRGLRAAAAAEHDTRAGCTARKGARGGGPCAESARTKGPGRNERGGFMPHARGGKMSPASSRHTQQAGGGARESAPLLTGSRHCGRYSHFFPRRGHPLSLHPAELTTAPSGARTARGGGEISGVALSTLPPSEDNKQPTTSPGSAKCPDTYDLPAATPGSGGSEPRSAIHSWRKIAEGPLFYWCLARSSLIRAVFIAPA